MHMNVFNNQAFNALSLTATLIDQPHVPQQLEQEGLFNSQGVRTRQVSIERQGNTLVLVQTTPRGAPRQQNSKDGRTLINIPTARIALEDTMTPDEVQDVRALGSESDLDTMMEEAMRRATRMSNSISATIEFHRVNAMKGIVLDADGSELLNLFTTFGVVAQTEVAIDFANTAEGALRGKFSAIIRLIEDELGGLPYTAIKCKCSSQFFDDLTGHAEYRANKKGFADARMLNDRTARRMTNFAGIDFEEYRGQIGGTKYVADNKAHFYPVGVPELWLTRYAPPPWVGFENTIGLPRYMKMVVTNQIDDQVLWAVETHVLNICTRPRVLIPAKRGA